MIIYELDTDIVHLQQLGFPPFSKNGFISPPRNFADQENERWLGRF
jgi:hypothetical protein